MDGDKIKNCKKVGLIIVIVLLCSGLLNKTIVKSGIEFRVNKDNGDITWPVSAIKATSGIRWQTKGYFISLESSAKGDIGYPLRRKTPMIKLYINNVTVAKKLNHSSKGVDKLESILSGKYVKKQIMENKAFFSKLIEKYKKGDKKLYIDTFFETYEVVNNANLRKEVIAGIRKKKKSDFEKPDGKYVYINGSKFDYDSKLDIVKKIRKNDLTDIQKIRSAEYWSEAAKKQWLNDGYYNHEIEYDIYSNVIVKYVDENGFIIGNKGSGVKINGIKAKSVFNGKKDISNPHYGYRMNGVGNNEIEHDEEKFFGEEATINLPKEITVTKNNKKIKYKLVSSKFYENENSVNPQNIKKGSKANEQKFVLGNEDAVVVGIYKGPPPKIVEEESEISNERPDPEPMGAIGSGVLENSPFDITKGMPVEENYYKNVITEEYLLKYRFKNRRGEKLYEVRSYINWKLSWTTVKNKKVIHHTATRRVDYTTVVKRQYSYWYIDNLEIYTLDGAALFNDAIPDTGIKMMPKGYVPPKAEYISDMSEDAHIKPPPESLKIINLGTRYANGKNIPSYDPKSEIEFVVGHPIVKNDYLAIDGNLIMNGDFVRKTAPKPLSPVAKGKKTENKILYEFGKKIETYIQNGVYESNGKVFYSLSDSINAEGESNIEFDIENVNQVRVHTPVVCDYNINDAKKWCQLINPDKSIYQLVLEKGFDIDVLTTGNHLDIKGYGDRDYSKYTMKKEIIFPFDVMMEGQLCPANVPIAISGNTHFHLPMTADEGKYTILIRTTAINYLSTSNSQPENYGNFSIENYIAENKIKVEVSGRLIDFTLLSVKNTSIWETENGNFALPQGARLKNLPLIEGDNPKFKNEGSFKKGYAVTFAMTAIGNYYNEPYGIRMDFDFFVLDDETGIKKPVDVYYEEASAKEDKKLSLIKIGSKKDRENIHYIKAAEGEIGLFRYNKALLPRQLLEIGSNKYIQRWKGEYSLPERIYVCERGFDLEGYLNKNMAIYFDENFWIKSGKLVVSADISTLKNKNKILSYINAENEKDGYFNNWKYETAGRTKKGQGGKEIKFEDGDLFVYDLSKKIWQERRSEVKKAY